MKQDHTFNALELETGNLDDGSLGPADLLFLYQTQNTELGGTLGNAKHGACRQPTKHKELHQMLKYNVHLTRPDKHKELHHMLKSMSI